MSANGQRKHESRRKLLAMKPPANVDGIVNLIEDGPEIFSVAEQSVLSHTAIGHHIGNAIVVCDSLEQRKRKALKQQGISYVADDRQQAKQDTVMYKECLARAVCHERWKQYTYCWESTVNRMSYNSVSALHMDERLLSLCLTERNALERCVGSIVSNVVRTSEVGFSVDLDERDNNPFTPILK
jgi:hypothetical protein